MTAIDVTACLPAWLPAALPAGIIITDAELSVRHWCSWLEQRSGLPAAALLGRPLLDSFPELRARGLEGVFRRALAGEPVRLQQEGYSYLLALPAGAPAEALAQRAEVCPLQMGGRVVGTVSTIIDLAEHGAAEEALRQQAAAQEALRQQEAYLSLAAHELRTPLTALLGRAQLLQRWLSEGDAADDRSMRSVGIVVEQAQRLDAMITSVLELSRAQLGRLNVQLQTLDLAGVARRAVEEQRAAAPGRRIALEAADGPLPARADMARIEQVLRSLIGNAVKFSPGGGPVLVRATRRGGEAWLSVADEGIGIPAGDQARLFEPHFRARNAERMGIKGLGVELFLAARIVALHGGDIAAESAEGCGSIFTVRLPLAEP